MVGDGEGRAEAGKRRRENGDRRKGKVKVGKTVKKCLIK